jgi:hypothetical protein
MVETDGDHLLPIELNTPEVFANSQGTFSCVSALQTQRNRYKGEGHSITCHKGTEVSRSIILFFL